MSGPDVDDDLLALSIVEPDAFTAARNARAKELRAAKEKERAAVVAKLPKPTWTSWALNVLARDHAEEVEAWLAAGDALDAALSGALSGDRDGLREAQQGERAALGHAVDRAGEILTGAGRKADDQARQRLTGTLRAAVTDAAVRDRLVRGVLADDVEAPSFGFGFGAPDGKGADVVSLDSARSRSTKAKKAAAKAGRGRSGSGTATADDEHEAAERERAEAGAEAERRAEARRAAEEERPAELARLEAEVAHRSAELDRLRAEADAAEEAARSAREAADAADQALAEARAAVAELPPLDD